MKLKRYKEVRTANDDHFVEPVFLDYFRGVWDGLKVLAKAGQKGKIDKLEMKLNKLRRQVDSMKTVLGRKNYEKMNEFVMNLSSITDLYIRDILGNNSDWYYEKHPKLMESYTEVWNLISFISDRLKKEKWDDSLEIVRKLDRTIRGGGVLFLHDDFVPALLQAVLTARSMISGD